MSSVLSFTPEGITLTVEGVILVEGYQPARPVTRHPGEFLRTYREPLEQAAYLEMYTQKLTAARSEARTRYFTARGDAEAKLAWKKACRSLERAQGVRDDYRSRVRALLSLL